MSDDELRAFALQAAPRDVLICDFAATALEIERLRGDLDILISHLVTDQGPDAGPYRYRVRLPDRSGFGVSRSYPTRDEAMEALRAGYGLGGANSDEESRAETREGKRPQRLKP